MFRPILFLGLAAILSLTAESIAQINPSGFQDPLGANRGGTGNPPNTTIGPIGGIGGSTLPPGAPVMSREIETNPALRQEVRRPFGGGGYRRANRVPLPSNTTDPNAHPNPNAKAETSGQSTAIAADGPATGKLAADWRYVYFKGRHWYWMPNNTWNVWHHGGWTAYKPNMLSQPIFGYGTQVRAYRGLPPDYQAGQPSNAPSESAQPASVQSDVGQASASQQTYAPQGTYAPATGNDSSGAGPAMQNEHFISP
jgi:hypothetical protein